MPLAQTLFNIGDPNNNSGEISCLLPGQFVWNSSGLANPIPVPGTFQSWRVRQPTAPGGATSRTFTLRNNGVDQSLAVALTGSNTDASDLSNTVAVAAGDLVSIRQTISGSPTDATLMQSAMEFVPDDGVSFIYGCFGNLGFAPNPGYTSIGDRTEPGSTEADRAALFAVAGSISKVYVNLSAAPTSTNTRVVTVFRNGVAQDGSGGTTDTRVTITGSATTGNASPALAVAANDLISFRISATGSPAGSNIAISIAFVPTTPGQVQIGGTFSISNTNNVTDYICPTASFVGTDATEANQELIGGGVASTPLTGLTVKLKSPPGAGKSHTFTLRVNQTDTALAVTISDLATLASVSGSVTLTTTDRWSLKRVNSSTAAGAIARVAFSGSGTPAAGAPNAMLLVSP